MKYFNKVKSYKELKETYRELLKKNHPDNGGNVETMQEINTEYDVAFRIWKNRAVDLTEEDAYVDELEKLFFADTQT